MVIECPSCATRFAVDDQSLARIAEPTFHCSRCGKHFKAEQNPLAKTASEPSPEILAQKDLPDSYLEQESASPPLTTSSEESEPDIVQESVKHNDAPETTKPLRSKPSELFSKSELTKKPKKGAREFKKVEETEGSKDSYWTLGGTLSESEKTQLDLLSTEQIENPDTLSREYQDFRPSLDIDRLLDEPSGGSGLTANWPSYGDSSAESSATQLHSAEDDTQLHSRFSFSEELDGASLRSSEEEEATLPPTSPYSDSESKSNFPKFSYFELREKLRKVKTKRPRLRKNYIPQSMLPKNILTGRKLLDKTGNPLFVALSMPFAMCILFLVWGLNIEKTPAPLRALFSFESGSFSSIPPAGLTLIGITPSLVSLESGHRILEISGNILNSTHDTFTGLKLEARSYTKENKLSSRIVAPVDNGLRDTDSLLSLRPSDLAELQSKTKNPQTVFPPSVVSPFRIVLPNVSGEEIWFSTRVYSSKKF